MYSAATRRQCVMYSAATRRQCVMYSAATRRQCVMYSSATRRQCVMYSAATLIFFKENTYPCKIILTAPLMPTSRDRRRSL